MAIIYVSNAATNGYAVGNDANSGLAKATPMLTYNGAKAVAVAGDTIKFNDGVFTSAAVFNHNIAVNLDCETRRGTTLQCTVAGTRGFLLGHPDGTTVTVGPLVFDDMGLSPNSFEITSGATLKASIFLDTEFRGGTQYAFRVDGANVVAMTDPTYYSTTATIAAAGFNTMGPGTHIDLVRPEIFSTNANNGIFSRGTPATPGYIRIKDAFGKVSKPGMPVTAISITAMNLVYDGQVDGMTQKILEVLAPSSPLSALLIVRPLAGAVMQAPAIRRLRGRLHPLHGYGVRVGLDGTGGAEDNVIPGGIVTECDLIGGGGYGSGIMFGSVNGGAASHNKLRGWGMSLRNRLQPTGAMMYSNDIQDGSSTSNGYVECSGSGAAAGPVYAFNNIRIRAGFENATLYVQQSPTDATPNLRCTWVSNNVFTHPGSNAPRLFYVQNDGSVCDFIGYNNYMVAGTLGATAFQYNATIYATVADWKATSFEPTATEWSPVAQDIRFWKYSYLPLRMMAFRNQPVLHNIFPVSGF